MSGVTEAWGYGGGLPATAETVTLVEGVTFCICGRGGDIGPGGERGHGVLVDRPEELPAAIAPARQLDPVLCRKHVEAGFTTQIMAAGYEAVCRRTLAEMADPRLHAVSGPEAVRAAN